MMAVYLNQTSPASDVLSAAEICQQLDYLLSRRRSTMSAFYTQIIVYYLEMLRDIPEGQTQYLHYQDLWAKRQRYSLPAWVKFMSPRYHRIAGVESNL